MPWLGTLASKSNLSLMTCPKGPSTQYLGTWDLGNSNLSTGLGEVYNY